MFPNTGEEDRLAGPPGEATLSAFDEWAAWQQDFFGPLFSLAASILPQPTSFKFWFIHLVHSFLCEQPDQRNHRLAVSAAIAMQNPGPCLTRPGFQPSLM